MEEMPYAFMAMSTLSSAVALFVAWAGLRRYRIRSLLRTVMFDLRSHQTRSDTKSRTL